MPEPVATALLPALLALLETESVTLAAERIGVGQPAMSRTLEKLREATGDTLLVRDGRRLVRTVRAGELLPEVRAVLDGASRILAPAMPFEARTASGVVTIALGDDTQAMLTGPLLERLRAEAPGLDIRVRSIAASVAGDAVRGLVDLAVFPDMRGMYVIPSIDELVLRPVYTRRFVVASRRRRRLDLDAFLAAEHVLVAPQGTEGGYVDDALRPLGRARRVAVAVPTFQAAIALVASSDLVGTLPDDVLRVLAPRLHRQVCPVTTPDLAMCVCWAARFANDERHRWLRSLVMSTLTDVVRVRSRAA